MAAEPPLRAFGEAARLTVGLVHIINDDPEAIAELLTAAGTGRFEHKVAELRQRREDEKAYQNTVNRSAGQGYTILDETPHYGDPSCVELRYLNTAEGQPATETPSPTPRTGRSTSWRTPSS